MSNPFLAVIVWAIVATAAGAIGLALWERSQGRPERGRAVVVAFLQAATFVVGFLLALQLFGALT